MPRLEIYLLIAIFEFNFAHNARLTSYFLERLREGGERESEKNTRSARLYVICVFAFPHPLDYANTFA